MKTRIQIAAVREAVYLVWLILGFTVAASADVIRQTVSYPPGAIASQVAMEKPTKDVSFKRNFGSSRSSAKGMAAFAINS